MIVATLLIGAVILSYALTWAVLRYALARNLFDVPNHRSSHHVPTPRGGGLAIAATFLAIVPVLTVFDLLPTNFGAGLLGGGILVAIIGFLDDHFDVPALWRLLVQTIAASWVVYWIEPTALMRSLEISFGSGIVLDMLIVVYFVWLTNVHNFMDGIDGIASVQVLTVCAGMTVLYVTSHPANSEWLASVLLFGCVAGFLFWNYPPARIFMGDVGSSFLGVALATISLQAAHTDADLFWGAIIVSAVFITDATFTLIRRILRGERFYQAHRSHAYQKAARNLGSHKIVTLSVGVINVFWLLPVALLVKFDYLSAIIGLLLAYVPMVVMAHRFGAGE